MKLSELRERRNEIMAIAASNGFSNVRVFGSVARGDEGASSDLDLLVTSEKPRAWGSIDMKLELEDLLGCPVDVVPDHVVNRHLREYIFREAIPL